MLKRRRIRFTDNFGYEQQGEVIEEKTGSVLCLMDESIHNWTNPELDAKLNIKKKGYYRQLVSGTQEYDSIKEG